MTTPTDDVDATLDARKRALRAQMRVRLAALTPDAFVKAGDDVTGALEPRVSKSGGAPVALFVGRPHELDLAALDALLRHRHVPRAFPVVVGDALAFRVVHDVTVAMRDLPRGAFGIHEPDASCPSVALSACALVVVPACALDGRGHRLGYGRGFYDRALVDVDLERAVGVCLDEQRVDEVPVGPRDRRLWHSCSPALGLVTHR
jgi:5-formyltetrahydrofolate cyclo-ligase